MEDTYVKVIYDELDIADAISKLSSKLKKVIEFDINEPPVYICIMDGAVQFFADVTKELPPGRCAYVKASSYKNNQQAGDLTVCEIPDDLDANQIFIFDDICDSGATLKTVRDLISSKYLNADVYTVAFINRTCNKKGVPDFSAITTSESVFFAGYGMDDKGIGRNIPFIYDCTEGK